MQWIDLKKKLGKVPKRIWVLILIIVIGFFLRTYHFRDWLEFNPDQARDATVVENVLNGQSSWLILGPEAGNTRFDLGPWFYHLEIISAKIFGNAPDKLAYPDLLFSILAIPLFYLFLKKYFSSYLSLALTGLYAVSFFSVRYSRFAWNINSIPFFVLLFLLGMLYLVGSDRKKGLWGAVMAGVGIGVGIQLHILLFFIMPSVTALAFLYLFLRKSPIVPLIGKIGIIFLLVLVTNAGQIIYEVKNHGLNTHMFIKSFKDSTVKIALGENLQADALCQVQANLHIISSLGNNEQCDFYQIYKKFLHPGNTLAKPVSNVSAMLVLIGALYSLGGYLLLAYFWRRENDERKKNFLMLVGIYGAVTFAAMFPVISQVALRYFLVSFFLPFILLGIMVQGLLRLRIAGIKSAIVVVFIALFALNGITEAKSTEKFFARNTNDDKNSVLGETEAMANYLIANANGSKIVYLKGDESYVKRFSKPLGYLLERSGIELKDSENTAGDSSPDAPVFFVVKSKNGKYGIGGKIGAYSEIKQIKIFNNVTIIIPDENRTD